MSAFVVISPATSPSIDAFEAAIAHVFPDRHFEIAKGQFVAMSSDLNATQIGERLGPEGKIGQFVVFAFDDHYGWHRTDLWKWLEAKAA